MSNEALRLADSIHEMNNAAYMTAIANLTAERDQLRVEVSELRAALWHVKHVAKDIEAAKTIAGDAIDATRTHKETP